MRLTIEIPNNQAPFMLKLLKNFAFVEVKEPIDNSILTKKMPSQNLLNLRGLGKEIWHNIDTENHIKTEREAWD